MTTITALTAIRTALTDKLGARLAMRWPQAAAYIPEGTTRVICGKPLPDADQDQLDTYALAYHDAIEDILHIVDKGEARPEPPMALRQAENSIFQGGSLPPAQGRNQGRPPRDSAKGRGDRRPSSREALAGLKGLFSGGSQ